MICGTYKHLVLLWNDMGQKTVQKLLTNIIYSNIEIIYDAIPSWKLLSGEDFNLVTDPDRQATQRKSNKSFAALFLW